MSPAQDKEKSESPSGIEPVTFRTPICVSVCFLLFQTVVQRHKLEQVAKVLMLV